jgi:hypothetical protein
MGSATDFDTAKAEFKAAWEALKARTPPSLLAAAFKARTSETTADSPNRRAQLRVADQF